MAEQYDPERMPERRHCENHSGQEEKIKGVGSKMNLLILLLLLQLGATGTFGVMVYNKNSSMSDDAMAQKTAVALIKDRQDNVLKEISELRQITQATDHRLDEMSLFKRK